MTCTPWTGGQRRQATVELVNQPVGEPDQPVMESDGLVAESDPPIEEFDATVKELDQPKEELDQPVGELDHRPYPDTAAVGLGSGLNNEVGRCSGARSGSLLMQGGQFARAKAKALF